MLKETYLAIKKRMEQDHPAAKFVVVTRTAHSVLAPPKDLLADVMRLKEQYLEQGFDIDAAKDRAWVMSEYEDRFREHLLGHPTALQFLHSLLNEAQQRDIFLVCYEKVFPCHRFILLDMAEQLQGYLQLGHSLEEIRDFIRVEGED